MPSACSRRSGRSSRPPRSLRWEKKRESPRSRQLICTACAALRRLGLAGCENMPARVLSQGQRRRTALARLALSEAMPLWILDEPFAALDLEAVEHVQNLIAAHVSRGAAVILTTHLEAKIAAALRIDLEGT